MDAGGPMMGRFFRRCLLAALMVGVGVGLVALPVAPPAVRGAESIAYESPRLEPVLLSPTLSLDEKLAEIRTYYDRRPWAVACRLGAIGACTARVALAWAKGADDDWDIAAARVAKARGRSPEASRRGLVLRGEVSKLGVVFVKLAQTLATRPDIVGEEVAAALESLQDSNAPFDDAVAKRGIDEGLRGVVELVELDDAPVAAASLAQVYRATTAGGTRVAVKVRRPGVVDQVALDCHAVRLALKALQAYWNSNSTDYPAIIDEVTAGLFRELDFRLEARNAPLFWQAHAAAAPYLRTPRVLADACLSPRVHVAEWINGASLSALPPDRQRDMVAKGLDVCFLQLFGTGFVHADPHYGNMLFDEADRLVLLDFGLVTKLEPRQTEAMAEAVAALVARDYRAVLAAFRAIGLCPPRPSIWVNPKTGELTDGLGPGSWAFCDEKTFEDGFVRALEENNDQVSSFTDITARLTKLALTYQFVLPPWLLFVVRAVITLDGFAAAMDPPLSALQAAAPHAATRVLGPQTRSGDRALRKAILLDADAKPPVLDLARLKALASQQEGAAAPRTSSSSSGAVVRKVVELLLEKPEGRSLRRLAIDVDSRPLLRLAAQKARRRALQPWRLNKEASPGNKNEALLETKPVGPMTSPPPRGVLATTGVPPPELGTDAGRFTSTPGAAHGPRYSRHSRWRVGKILLKTHLLALAKSPSGLASLALFAAASTALGLRLLVDRAARALTETGRRLLRVRLAVPGSLLLPRRRSSSSSTLPQGADPKLQLA